MGQMTEFDFFDSMLNGESADRFQRALTVDNTTMMNEETTTALQTASSLQIFTSSQEVSTEPTSAPEDSTDSTSEPEDSTDSTSEAEDSTVSTSEPEDSTDLTSEPEASTDSTLSEISSSVSSSSERVSTVTESMGVSTTTQLTQDEATSPGDSYSQISTIVCDSGTLIPDCKGVWAPQLCETTCSTLCPSMNDSEELPECLHDDVFLCCNFVLAQSHNFFTNVVKIEDDPRHYNWTIQFASHQLNVEPWSRVEVIMDLASGLPDVCRGSNALVTGILDDNLILNQSLPLTFSGNQVRISVSVFGFPTPEVTLGVFKIDLKTLMPHCELDPYRAGVSIQFRRTVGYIMREECTSITDCDDCRGSGCNYCSWESSTHSDPPPLWVPQWDVIAAATSSRGQLCGVHQTVCSWTFGSSFTCEQSQGETWDMLLMWIPLTIGIFCIVIIFWRLAAATCAKKVIKRLTLD